MAALPRKSFVTAGLIALAAGALAPAAAASEKASIVTVSASKVVRGPVGTTDATTVHCPRGTRVLSGGYDSSFSAGALLPHVSKRTGPRSWRVSAYRVGGGSGRLKLTVYAKCGDLPGRLRSASEQVTVPVPAGNVALRTVRPRCPGNDFAISGGFKLTVAGRFAPNSPPAAVVMGSRAEGREWAVTAARLAPSGESKLTAIAYCTSERPFKRGISGIFPASRRPGPERLTPFCPRGMSAASGGFLAHFPHGAASGVMIPVTSHPVGSRRWTSTGVPQNADSFFSAYAYCI
jgi:hypothetical protein